MTTADAMAQVELRMPTELHHVEIRLRDDLSGWARLLVGLIIGIYAVLLGIAFGLVWYLLNH